MRRRIIVSQDGGENIDDKPDYKQELKPFLEEAVETWMLFPNHEVIYTRLNIEGNLKTVFYNIIDKKYKVVSEGFYNQIVKLKGEYLINDLCDDELSGNVFPRFGVDVQ